ncbi:MAG: hypothetical protein FWD85_06995 [Microbacteriaceae bacterium]|nr:hypothetical protein [Microbacteriaceae bacterium]
MITADSTRESVHAFAQAVRDALTDLPADEVDELTDGLEADLFERAEELGGTDGFGEPVVYADELRASAGLPERAAAAAHRAGMRELRDGWVAAAAAFWRQTVATPFAREVTRAALALRPVWWVLRGWTVYQVFALAIWGAYSASVVPLGLGGAGKNALRWLLLIAIVLISVQWGRGGGCRAAGRSTCSAS